MISPGSPFYYPRPVGLPALWVWRDIASGSWVLYRQLSPVAHRAEAVCRTRAQARLLRWVLSLAV